MGKKKGSQAIEASRVLGENLLASRRRAGLSQEGVADRAGLHRTHVAYIELGTRAENLDESSIKRYINRVIGIA